MFRQLKWAWVILACFIPVANANFSLKSPGLQPAKITQTGETFATALNNSDVQLLKTVVDADHLAVSVFDAVFGKKDAKSRGEFVKGFRETIYTRSFASWFTLLDRTGGLAQYKSTIEVDGRKRALIRLDLKDEGLNFLELILDPRTGKIIDFFSYTTGQNASDSMSSLVALAVPNGSGLLERIFGTRKLDKETAKAFRQIGDNNRQGKYAESYQIVKNLPKEYQGHRIIASLRVSFSGYVSEALYFEELENLAREFGEEPELALMLFDYYFLKEQFDKAMEAIELVESRVGEDSLLTSFKATVQMSDNRQELALTHINRAIELEESQQDFYWIKAEIFHRSKQFADMTALFDWMAKKFDLAFMPEFYESEPGYEDFVKSDAFAKWRQQYSQ